MKHAGLIFVLLAHAPLATAGGYPAPAEKATFNAPAPKATPVEEKAGEASAPAEAEVKSQATERRFFPAWESEKPDFDLVPILGYKLGETKTIASAARSSGFEGGGKISYDGLRLKRGNPGFTLGLGATGAFGFTKTTLANENGAGSQDSTVRFHRYAARAGFTLYLKMVKMQGEIARGLRKYQLDGTLPVQDIDGNGDLGIRVFRWLDLHNGISYRHVFAEEPDDPTTVELDSIPYARVAIAPLHSTIEMGPGVGYTQESAVGAAAAEGWVKTYAFKFVTKDIKGYDVHGRVRYVANTTDPGLGRYATTRLSTDDFHEPPRLTPPEDTLTTSFAITANYGWAVLGWWFNWQIFDYNEKGGKKAHTNRESGVSAFFGYDL